MGTSSCSSSSRFGADNRVATIEDATDQELEDAYENVKHKSENNETRSQMTLDVRY